LSVACLRRGDLVSARRSRLVKEARIARSESFEILASLVQAQVVCSAAVVRILELDGIVFPQADLARAKRARRLLI
jgi:hypothetical protein